MKKTKIICSWCNKESEKPTSEIRRRLKLSKTNFFCNTSCAAKWHNENSGKKSEEFEMTCKCGKKFKTSTRRRSKRHCSSSCASKYSVTEKRIEGNIKGGKNSPHTVEMTSKAMKSREEWKYKKLKSFLEFQKEDFEFEFVIEDYIFDLAIKSRMIIIEFDGVYHKSDKQSKIDIIKNKIAKDNGWNIIRIETKHNAIIDSSVLYKILS